MTTRSEPLRVGEVLAGKYRLEALLGAGGMGQVYRAQNELIGRAVAIKVLHPEYARDGTIVQRFLREARAANLVRHENVVDVLDVGTDAAGAPFIVQDLLEGHDLARYVEQRGGRLGPAEALDLMLPVLDAVGVAHSRGVVHRDLKPENVFLDERTGRTVPKVLDFGISKLAAAGDVRVTSTGAPLGTPAYMSPEQVRGASDVDARADVWALGVMLYELLAGERPFDARTPGALFVAICTQAPTPLAEIAPAVPTPLANAVDRCLRARPAERFEHAGALAAALRTARAAIPASVLAAAPAPAAARALRELPTATPEAPASDHASAPTLASVSRSVMATRPAGRTPSTPIQPAPRTGARARVLLGGAALLLATAGVWLGVARSGAPAPNATAPGAPDVPLGAALVPPARAPTTPIDPSRSGAAARPQPVPLMPTLHPPSSTAPSATAAVPTTAAAPRVAATAPTRTPRRRARATPSSSAPTPAPHGPSAATGDRGRAMTGATRYE